MKARISKKNSKTVLTNPFFFGIMSTETTRREYEMFGKKKKIEEQPSFYDQRMEELRSELGSIGWAMGKKVRSAYLKDQAVNLYASHQPDWKQACDDAESARKSLHCSIGEYDAKRAEILRLMSDHGSELRRHWVEPVTSHEWIEKELERLIFPQR